MLSRLKRTKCVLFICILFLLISSLLGVSNFIISYSIGENYKGNVSDEPVCFNSNTQIFYTTIEKALEDAGANDAVDIIVVLPGTNPVITRDCTISNEDKLIVSFDEYGTSGSWKAADNFYDGSTYHNKPVTFLNTVTISENVTLTNYGVLENYGELVAAVGGNWGGFPAKNCTQFLLEKNAIIDNYGTINAFGYFSESDLNNGSMIINNPNAVMHIPFSIYFRGGTVTIALTGGINLVIKKIEDLSDAKIFPFDQYEIVNLTTLIQAQSGSYIYAHLNFNLDTSLSDTPNRKTFSTEINLIGDKNLANCLFKLNDNSYVNIKYDGVKNNINPIKIDFYGGMSMEEVSLTMSISIGITVDRTVNTSQYYFPFCENMHISLNKTDKQIEAEYTFENLIKFMPGSSLTINEGVTLNLTGTTVFYKDKTSGEISPAYKAGYGDAELLVIGNLKANNFGGFVSTNSTTSQFIISGNNNITTQELISNSAVENFYTYNNLAEGYVNDNKDVGELENSFLYRGMGYYWDSSPIVSIDQKNVESISVVDSQGNIYQNLDVISEGTDVTVTLKYLDLPNKQLIINDTDYSSEINGTMVTINLTATNTGILIKAYAGVYKFNVQEIYNSSFSATDDKGENIVDGSDIVYGETIHFNIHFNETISRVIFDDNNVYNYNNNAGDNVIIDVVVNNDINFNIYSGIRSLTINKGSGVESINCSGDALFNDNNLSEIVIGYKLSIDASFTTTLWPWQTKKIYLIINNNGIEDYFVNGESNYSLSGDEKYSTEITVTGNVVISGYES